MHVAASEGFTARIRELIKEGHEVNAPTRFGMTALRYALGRSCTESITVLLENGAIGGNDPKFHPLLTAYLIGKMDHFHLLLSYPDFVRTLPSNFAKFLTRSPITSASYSSVLLHIRLHINDLAARNKITQSERTELRLGILNIQPTTPVNPLAIKQDAALSAFAQLTTSESPEDFWQVLTALRYTGLLTNIQGFFLQEQFAATIRHVSSWVNRPLDDSGDRIVHRAARIYSASILTSLLDHFDIEINARNRRGQTARDVLHERLSSQERDSLDLFLAHRGGLHGYQIDQNRALRNFRLICHQDYTPQELWNILLLVEKYELVEEIHRTVSRSDFSYIIQQINDAVNIPDPKTGRTFAHLAAMTRSSLITEFLVRYTHIRFDVTDNNGITPMAMLQGNRSPVAMAILRLMQHTTIEDREVYVIAPDEQIQLGSIQLAPTAPSRPRQGAAAPRRHFVP